MAKNADRPRIWPLWLEIALTVFIPFVIWWSNTPTNILNSSSLWKLLEFIGISGNILLLRAGIPVGIIGIIAAKKMTKCRIAAIVLSVINLSAGIIEVGLLIATLFAAVFGGASV